MLENDGDHISWAAVEEGGGRLEVGTGGAPSFSAHPLSQSAKTQKTLKGVRRILKAFWRHFLERECQELTESADMNPGLLEQVHAVL